MGLLSCQQVEFVKIWHVSFYGILSWNGRGLATCKDDWRTGQFGHSLYRDWKTRTVEAGPQHSCVGFWHIHSRLWNTAVEMDNKLKWEAYSLLFEFEPLCSLAFLISKTFFPSETAAQGDWRWGELCCFPIIYIFLVAAAIQYVYIRITPLVLYLCNISWWVRIVQNRNIYGSHFYTMTTLNNHIRK